MILGYFFMPHHIDGLINAYTMTNDGKNTSQIVNSKYTLYNIK